MYRPHIHSSSPWRRRFSAALPWVFVLGMAAGTMLPVKRWVNWPSQSTAEWDTPAARDATAIVTRAGNGSTPYPVDVLHGIDGDTFAARVHLQPGTDLNARIRLRGIDAPELKGQCAQEIRLAEAEARRAAAPINTANTPKEFQGPEGPEPTRFGDWERKGIASDF